MNAAYRRQPAQFRPPPFPAADTISGAAPVTLLAPLNAGNDVCPSSPRFDGGYGTGKRANWPLIVALALVHLALLYALVTFDVIPIGRAQPTPIVVELIELPDLAVPTPAPPAPIPPEPVRQPLVNPKPVVALPIESPIRMAAVVQPPKIAAPAPAVPRLVATPPAPVTPPDFSAGYLNNPAPHYPIESRRLREQGMATIKVLVAQSGEVEELMLAESSGHARLDKAALAAVRKWRFEPARQAGKPVAAWVIVPIPFTIKG